MVKKGGSIYGRRPVPALQPTAKISLYALRIIHQTPAFLFFHHKRKKLRFDILNKR